MGQHIDEVVNRCHGLLGMLRRSTIFLPKVLLKLIYTSTIRSQLEYCSATFYKAATTHLTKLDIIQKIASRIITDSTPPNSLSSSASTSGVGASDHQKTGTYDYTG